MSFRVCFVAICFSLSLSKFSCVDLDLSHLCCSLSHFHIDRATRGRTPLVVSIICCLVVTTNWEFGVEAFVVSG